jgi:leucyl-tRNA synthetase
MHRFLDTFYVLMAPITPHLCEYVWGELLGHGARTGLSVTRAPWPAPGAPDAALLLSDDYLSHNIHAFRLTIAKLTVGKPGKAPKAGAAAAPKATRARIFVAADWPEWQKRPLRHLAALWAPPAAGAAEGSWAVADPVGAIKDLAMADAALKPNLKKIMQLASTAVAEMKGRAALSPALALRLPFDEAAAWRDNAAYVGKCLDLADGVEVVLSDDARLAAEDSAKAIDPLGKAKAVLPMDPDVFPC